ncbi:MAG: Abi-alpha family protein [bacterium]
MKAKISITEQNAEIEASQEEVSEFLEKVIPNFVIEGGGILADTVRFWRWKNQINIIKKAKIIVENSKLDKKQVPLKILLPIMENSSLEEDEIIQNKWANILANAITASRDITPNYAEILKELSVLEVVILDQLFDESSKENDYEKRKQLQFGKQKISEIFKLSSEQADLIIENLYRLNLCQAPAGHGIAVGQYKFALRTTEVFEFTTFGYYFVQACKWEQ